MTNDTLLRQQTTTDLKKQVITLVIWAQKSILLLYWIIQFSFANRRICLHNELINSSINPLVLSLQRRSMATNLLVCFQTFRSNDSMMTVSTTTTNYYYKSSAIIYPSYENRCHHFDFYDHDSVKLFDSKKGRSQKF